MSSNAPTDAQAASFDMVQPMLVAAHKELSELSKKKQDGILNDLKVRHVNRLLERAKEALGDDETVELLETLDRDTLPENSDAVLVIGQWLAAMTQFKALHTHRDFSGVRWISAEYLVEHPEEADDWDDEGLEAEEDDE